MGMVIGNDHCKQHQGNINGFGESDEVMRTGLPQHILIMQLI